MNSSTFFRKKDPNAPVLSDFDKLHNQILETRTLNKAQEEIIHAFFKENSQRIFLRIGRKGSKTATLIMVAWLFAHLRPGSMINFLYPTNEQGFDVLFEEERLINCDLGNPSMREEWIEKVDSKVNSMHVLFKNGSKIRVQGTWSQTRSRGTQPDLMIADEIQDTRPEFLAATEPNLLAKPDARFILSGTPPNKRTHYHEWEERTIKTLGGKRFHYSSYINTSLPHLKIELDKKRNELIEAGKEDEWRREYLAEDCFSSEDRILPDAIFKENEDLISLIRGIHHAYRTHIIGLYITETKICVITAVMEKKPYEANKIYIMDYIVKNKIWEGSFREMYEKIPEMCEKITSIPFKSWRKWVCDESNAFIEVIPGFIKSREEKGFKWSDRGIPLMREMMNLNRLVFSDKVFPVGMEVQNYLKGEDCKKYPIISAISMIVNEHYIESRNKPKNTRELTDEELICDSLNLRPQQRNRGERIMSYNWNR
jgi:hypothetical protein